MEDLVWYVGQFFPGLLSFFFFVQWLMVCYSLQHILCMIILYSFSSFLATIIIMPPPFVFGLFKRGLYVPDLPESPFSYKKGWVWSRFWWCLGLHEDSKQVGQKAPPGLWSWCTHYLLSPLPLHSHARRPGVRQELLGSWQWCHMPFRKKGGTGSCSCSARLAWARLCCTDVHFISWVVVFLTHPERGGWRHLEADLDSRHRDSLTGSSRVDAALMTKKVRIWTLH